MTSIETTALTLAQQYLASIGESDVPLTLKDCQFCHSEPLVMLSTEQQKQFKEQGGFIVRLPTYLLAGDAALPERPGGASFLSNAK
jgi:hypothetical protein